MLSQARCNSTQYSELGSLLLASGEGAVRALYLRGAPSAVGPTALVIAMVTWMLFTVLTAGAPLSVGCDLPHAISRMPSPACHLTHAISYARCLAG